MTGERNEAPFSLWSFLRSVLSQGADIHLDHQGKDYELHSARLDEAAREREEQLTARLQPARVPDEQYIRFDYLDGEGREQCKMITHEDMRQRYAELFAQKNILFAAAPAPEADAKGGAVACIDARHLQLLRQNWSQGNTLKHPKDAGDGDVLLYTHPAPEPAEAVKQGEGREGVGAMTDADRVPDDYRNQATGYRAGWNDRHEIASAQQAGVPAMDDEVRWILGQPNFACISYANALRRLGHSIPNKSEEEQAAVIHWMLTVYAQHGESWREEGAKILRGQRTGSRGEVGDA